MSSYFSGGASASGGSPYFGGSDGTPPPKKHGGFFHTVGHAAHVTAGKLELAGHDLLSIPGGLVQIGEATVRSANPLLGLAQSHIPHVPGVPSVLQPNQENAPSLETIGKGVVKQTVETVEHPFRDPFLTLTALAPVLRLAGSAAIRTGSAAGAVRAGENVSGAAKAAARKPDLGPRLISYGGKKVPLYASSNPAVRLAQAGYDRLIQHALDTNPDSRLGSHAAKRIGGSLAETGRYQTRMREAPASLVERGGQKLGPRKFSPVRLTGRVPRKVQEAALRLAAENSSAEEAAAFHRAQAADGFSPARNLRQARLYDQVVAANLLTKAGGDVVVNAAEHPNLAALDAEIARGQDQVDRIIAEHGLMTDEQLAARKNRPARIRAGATEEAAAAAEQQTELIKRNAAEDARRLATRERALNERAARESQQRTATVARAERPSLAEKNANEAAGRASRIRTRIASVDAQIAETRALHERANGYLGEMMQHGFETRAVGTRAFRPLAQQQDFVGELAARYDRLYAVRSRLADKHAPLAEKAARQAELAARRRSRVQGVAASHAAKGAVLADQQAATAAERASVPRLLYEKLAANPVPGEDARPGRGFVSYRTTEPRRPKGQVASSGPVVGKQRSFLHRDRFTGQGLEHGVVPDNTSRLVARHMRDAYRYVSTDVFRRVVLATGSKARRTSRDVLVRDPDAKAGEFDAETDRILGKTASTVGELDAVMTGFDAWRQTIVPGLRDDFAEDRAQGIGKQAPEGFRWVDRNVLGDLGRPGPGPRGALGRTADKINTAVTAATVYFKLGHVGTRVFTNAATNILQGSATPVQIGHSIRLWEALAPLERAKALAASGQHGFAALPLSDESGIVSKSISGAGRVGAQWWARHADAPFRFNSIAYEARKTGFDTPEKFRLLLDQLENPHEHNLNAAQAAKVDWVAKRANREGIAYDRLNDFERRTITRGFWFYPWTAGAARFAVNTLLEHPYKTGVLGAAGGLGRKQQAFDLGDLPSYEGGLFKLAGGTSPLVADFSTFSPLATPGELLQTPSVGSAAEYLNPAYSALFRLAARENQYGQHSNTPVTDALGAIFSPAPEAQLLSALRHRHDDQSGRMFHKTPLNVLARAGVGPGLPRRINLPAGHKAAARERSGR